MIDYANLAELTAAKYTSAPVFEGITREKSLEVAEVGIKTMEIKLKFKKEGKKEKTMKCSTMPDQKSCLQFRFMYVSLFR